MVQSFCKLFSVNFYCEMTLLFKDPKEIDFSKILNNKEMFIWGIYRTHATGGGGGGVRPLLETNVLIKHKSEANTRAHTCGCGLFMLLLAALDGDVGRLQPGDKPCGDGGSSPSLPAAAPLIPAVSFLTSTAAIMLTFPGDPASISRLSPSRSMSEYSCVELKSEIVSILKTSIANCTYSV